jgi:murein DD-endopeptidase MepM/ murein hydrolase activator NlpD
MKVYLYLIVVLLSLPVAVLANSELPVENGVVTSGVGLRIDPFGSGKLVFHRGIDIAVPVGTPVRSVRNGRVVFAGERSGYGSTVIIEHANGDRTLYGHNALIRVHPNELVDAGTVVAFSGNTGRSTGPHVHFEQLPSGRPVIDLAESEDNVIPQQVNNDNQRYVLEQKMEESVNSILKTINRDLTSGQGG